MMAVSIHGRRICRYAGINQAIGVGEKDGGQGLDYEYGGGGFLELRTARLYPCTVPLLPAVLFIAFLIDLPYTQALNRPPYSLSLASTRSPETHATFRAWSAER
ncbi:hypothetical protein Hypma_002012 [Hypsizygus marmoreus]|uniref:Uncharacterized protein n=1 Tax=Hypsizygus marmoreus TaxID=39966 RepID=A0A369J620_HYPMA|nr:hypothetical protein Hypma_002012 [Hypsizygus marmoreus]